MSACRPVHLVLLEHSSLAVWEERASSPRWEDSLQRDVEVERQIRLQVVVRLVAARRRERLV